MNRRSILDETVIKSPCTANWDDMKGTAQIRYCSECRKYVYNISEMTRREAESLLASRGNNMCARMVRDLKGQTITLESLPPVRLFGWKPGPITTAVVSAIISITPAASPCANGQSKQVNKHDTSGRRTNGASTAGITSAITGTVTNEKGEALTGAVVTLTSEASGEVLSQVTYEGGEFRFDGLVSRTYIVEIKANGYEHLRHADFTIQQGEVRRFDVAMQTRIVLAGAIYIPPQPLRALYLNSDRVVIATVGQTTDVKRDGSARLVKTSLQVTQTIKGDGHKSTVEAYQWVYSQTELAVWRGRRDQGQLNENEQVLAFLQRTDDAAGSSDGYELTDLRFSARHLSKSDLEIYTRRLEELKTFLGSEDSQPSDITEWLVRCAENPITRREGTFELLTSFREEMYEREKRDREISAGEPSDTQSKKRQQPNYSALLTNEQKDRLMKALLKSETLDVDGDVDLIELARRWEDPRVLPFLLGYLHRSTETASGQVEAAMEVVAEILDDKNVTALFEHYRNNASFGDLDEEESEEDEDNDPDEDASAIEDETTEASDEIDDAPILTPEAARQARVEMLKRFIEAVEVRMKISRAKSESVENR